VIAVDHSDPEGDVTLAGESVPCLELLRTWSRRADDPHVLTLASRGPTDPLDIDVVACDRRRPAQSSNGVDSMTSSSGRRLTFLIVASAHRDGKMHLCPRYVQRSRSTKTF
jgi:hypothetical protein